ncbi:MAG TPA: hypothetical protein VJ697_15370, partial [Nitrososphaeraceae archaeon]|nr:hypothetical protein [Nitrososphaeraceae archaeon]
KTISYPQQPLSSEEKISQRLTLKYLIFSMIIAIIIANVIVIFSEEHSKHSVSLWTLNITAAIASILCIITICRYGIHGLHGKSYLFLALGIICWFSADFTLLYNYYALGIEEQRLVTITDILWFAGYGFLALHLFIIIRSLHIKIKSKLVIGVSLITVLLISYNLVKLLSYDSDIEDDFIAIIVTLLYPILDFILIIPSSIILVTLRKDYEHNIPWLLSSLSLLVNAIADDGYVNDFVTGNSENLWFWELFYITDFIIMSGALFWYNKFHVSHSKKIKIE